MVTMEIIRSLVDRTRRAALWNRALDAYNSGKTTESIALINRMQEIAPLRDYHWAFLGTAYVLAKDSLKARNAFQRAKSMTDCSKDPSAQYVNAYSRLYLKLMVSDASYSELRLRALSIECRPSLKRWLPLEEIKNR